MKRINFDPNNLDGADELWWEEWSEKASKSTKEIIDTYEKNGKLVSNDFNNSIWSELKVWLLSEVFHGKCAYCETPKIRTYFDAEHFRPKGGVKYKTKDGKEKSVKCDTPFDKDSKHPGYFWLAYDWKNLLPSCRFCNAGEGKMNQFPVENTHVFILKLDDSDLAKLSSPPIESDTWEGHYYLKSEDLDKLEKRQLLHPLYDDPLDHLDFLEKGFIEPKTDKGKHSIAVFTLEEAELTRQRHLAQFNVKSLYHSGILQMTLTNVDGSMSGAEINQAVKNKLRKDLLEDLKTPYCTVRLHYLDNGEL